MVSLRVKGKYEYVYKLLIQTLEMLYAFYVINLFLRKYNVNNVEFKFVCISAFNFSYIVLLKL